MKVRCCKKHFNLGKPTFLGAGARAGEIKSEPVKNLANTDHYYKNKDKTLIKG